MSSIGYDRRRISKKKGSCIFREKFFALPALSTHVEEAFKGPKFGSLFGNSNFAPKVKESSRNWWSFKNWLVYQLIIFWAMDSLGVEIMHHICVYDDQGKSE